MKYELWRHSVLFLSVFITVTLSPALIFNKTLPRLRGQTRFFALPDCLSPFNFHIKQAGSLKCPYPLRFSRVRVKGRQSGEYTIPGREARKCYVSHLNEGRKKPLSAWAVSFHFKKASNDNAKWHSIYIGLFTVQKNMISLQRKQNFQSSLLSFDQPCRCFNFYFTSYKIKTCLKR